jgi:hypothetical protein
VASFLKGYGWGQSFVENRRSIERCEEHTATRGDGALLADSLPLNSSIAYQGRAVTIPTGCLPINAQRFPVAFAYHVQRLERPAVVHHVAHAIQVPDVVELGRR